MLNFSDTISFTKAIYHNLTPVPLPKPFKDATGGFGQFAPLQGWVEIFDSEGYSGGVFCSRGVVDNILPLILTGETKSYDRWYHDIYWRLRNFGFQSGQIVDLGQFELAMLDILARRAKQPLHRFLGAKKDWASVYKGGGAITHSDEELLTDLSRYAGEGYDTVKFKVGSEFGKDMTRDVRRMKLLRRELGDKLEIAVDGNQVWSVDDALRFADLIRPYRPAWFEEPINSHDMNGIQKLKDRRVNMRLGFGESMRNFHAFETYVEKGVDHLMPLVGRLSSLGDMFRIRKLARDNGLMFSSGGTIWINAAFGAVFDEDERLEFHEPVVQTIGDYLEVKPEERDARLYLPDIIGLPVRLNLKKLEMDGVLESTQYFYTKTAKGAFAVRAAY
jgi:L-alanine-DL-glutamate epimerase-like enolase superfamily enzyme